jgi:hypothetical protein
MTIGIVAYGPNAGRAVFDALRAVERVASGAIGGFASFVAISGDARLHRVQTQRGGTATLFTDGETTGVEPPGSVAGALLAGVMSSGPDRPEPLMQFTPAEAALGIVSGHRLPNMPGADGRPLNQLVLDLMRQGLAPEDAVAQVSAGNPNADAGFIAGDLQGRIAAGNSARVARRPDLGHARRQATDGRAVVEVLHNAIVPAGAIAALAAETALETMLALSQPESWIEVRAGTPVLAGARDRVIVDANALAVAIETTDHRILTGRWNCAAIYLGSEVVRDDAVVGSTVVEPNAVVEDGALLSLSGQGTFRLGFRRLP